MRLEGKTAIISGGGGNIGSAICRQLAGEGAAVIVGDAYMEGARACAEHIAKSGGKAEAALLNVLDDACVERVFADVAARYGHVDIAVNVAGGSARGRIRPLYDQSMDVVDEILNINLRGALLVMRQAAIQMKKQRSGVIINIASVVGLQGMAGLVDYAAAKAGLIGASKSLALEMGPYHVRVNCVSPGKVPRPDEDAEKVRRTNALGAICSAEDIANMVTYLTTDAADFVTGQNFIVDGGRSLGLYGDTGRA